MAEEDPKSPSSKQGWWVVGASALAGALAGALALNSPKMRRMLTVNDVTTGLSPDYPDIQPQVFPEPVDEVLVAAVEVCEDLGWRVVAEDLIERRIHTEIPVPPGSIDDFDVWFTETEDGTTVHVRSRARIGRGDFGVNARHIRAFQRALSRRL